MQQPFTSGTKKIHPPRITSTIFSPDAAVVGPVAAVEEPSCGVNCPGTHGAADTSNFDCCRSQVKHDDVTSTRGMYLAHLIQIIMYYRCHMLLVRRCVPATCPFAWFGSVGPVRWMILWCSAAIDESLSRDEFSSGNGRLHNVLILTNTPATGCYSSCTSLMLGISFLMGPTYLGNYSKSYVKIHRNFG